MINNLNNSCRPDIDVAMVSFLFSAGNRFLVFDCDGKLIYAVSDREAAEAARNVVHQASPVAEIKQIQGELALSFGIEAVEFFS